MMLARQLSEAPGYAPAAGIAEFLEDWLNPVPVVKPVSTSFLATACFWDMIIFATVPLALVLSSGFLYMEVLQMEDGLAGYFESFWNYVDVTAFTMQILVDLEVILGFGVTILRPMSAVSLLCLFVKILYFARGFGRWGTQVKMMFKILEDMQPFLLILMVFVSGFGVAFWIVLHDENESFSEPGKSITYVLNLAVYGQGELDPMDNTYLTASFGQILMLFISLVLLNMLIAIMSDTFDHCVKTAQVDNVVAKAEIVLEMEEIWLPTLSRHVPESAKYYIKRWFDLDLVDVRANLSTRKVFYPKYLHVLKPTIARGEESGGMSGSASAEGGALQSTSPINGGSRHRATDEGQRRPQAARRRVLAAAQDARREPPRVVKQGHARRA